MKSYKDVKARFKVGMELEAVNYVIPQATGRRKVTKVQTNGYWYEQLTEPVGIVTSRVGRRCWYQFPAKAAGCRIDGPDQVTFLSDGEPLVTIRFLS